MGLKAKVLYNPTEEKLNNFLATIDDNDIYGFYVVAEPSPEFKDDVCAANIVVYILYYCGPEEV